MLLFNIIIIISWVFYFQEKELCEVHYHYFSLPSNAQRRIWSGENVILFKEIDIFTAPIWYYY